MEGCADDAPTLEATSDHPRHGGGARGGGWRHALGKQQLDDRKPRRSIHCGAAASENGEAAIVVPVV